jgi:hypothetical protein
MCFAITCSNILTDLPTASPRVDLRTRRERVEVLNNSWQQQLDVLTDAYLIWRQTRSPRVDEASSTDQTWEIMTIDFFGMYPVDCPSSPRHFTVIYQTVD